MGPASSKKHHLLNLQGFIGEAIIGQTLSTTAEIMLMCWQCHSRQLSVLKYWKKGLVLSLLLLFPIVMYQCSLSLHSSWGYVYFIWQKDNSLSLCYIGPTDVSFAPVETFSTLCNWHWNSPSIRIPLSIQRQHSNYVLLISEQWVSAAWYGVEYVIPSLLLNGFIQPAFKLSSCAPPSRLDRVGPVRIGTVLQYRLLIHLTGESAPFTTN